MKSATCTLADSLYESRQKRVQTEKAIKDHVVSMALAQYFGKPLHPLFQISMLIRACARATGLSIWSVSSAFSASHHSRSLPSQ